MAYIPKNKYQVLYTNGSKYKLATTNKPYTGKYIKLTNGKMFAGEDPSNIIGALKPLKITYNRNIKPGKNNDTYSVFLGYKLLILSPFCRIPYFFRGFIKFFIF